MTCGICFSGSTSIIITHAAKRKYTEFRNKATGFPDERKHSSPNHIFFILVIHSLSWLCLLSLSYFLSLGRTFSLSWSHFLSLPCFLSPCHTPLRFILVLVDAYLGAHVDEVLDLGFGANNIVSALRLRHARTRNKAGVAWKKMKARKREGGERR